MLLSQTDCNRKTSKNKFSCSFVYPAKITSFLSLNTFILIQFSLCGTEQLHWEMRGGCDSISFEIMGERRY